MACHKEDMKQCYLRESVEIALLDLNFSFTQTQIKLAIEAWNMGMSIEERAKLRSKTFPGIAKAMAEQWGK